MKIDIVDNGSITVFKGKNINKLYKPILDYLWKNGIVVNPRGKETKELYSAITIIEKPLECINTIYGRGGNPFFQVAEIMWILAGRADIEWIKYYNKNIEQFGDDNYKEFNGAYGARIRDWGRNRDGVYVNKPIDQLKAV